MNEYAHMDDFLNNLLAQSSIPEILVTALNERLASESQKLVPSSVAMYF